VQFVSLEELHGGALPWARSLLKKGTGSERDIKIPSEFACREVPVPLFQQAAT
jgi:hypothetical protein